MKTKDHDKKLQELKEQVIADIRKELEKLASHGRLIYQFRLMTIIVKHICKA